ncbi:MAG: YcxB family protein [Sandaracinaceae bacterium]|nr:YcxB family protein [Sandaracinaceae bacterium]
MTRGPSEGDADTDAGRVIVAGVTRLEASDFVAAHRDVPALRAARRKAAILPGLFVAGALLFLVTGLAQGSVSLLITAAFVGTLAAVSGRRTAQQPVLAWRAIEEWQRQLRVEITERRLRLRTERTQSEADWGLFAGWLEGPEAFYLEQAGAQFQIVPKRAFENEAELALVRETLARHVRDRPELRGSRGAARSWRPLRVLLLWVVLVLAFAVVYDVMVDTP